MNDRKLGLSQEGLKLIAVVTMLIDHIGAIFYPGLMQYRMIGRISFPIYCFLLAEGAHFTRNPVKYGMRLLLAAGLSEIPYDLAFYGRLRMDKCSVMVTLLLGYAAVLAVDRARRFGKILAFVPFWFLAELLHTDYAGMGIALIVWMAMVRQNRHAQWLRGVGMFFLLWYGLPVRLGSWQVPIQLFGLLALIPIHFYSGQKRTDNKIVQWGFYLFYPVHLFILFALSR